MNHPVMDRIAARITDKNRDFGRIVVLDDEYRLLECEFDHLAGGNTGGFRLMKILNVAIIPASAEKYVTYP